MTSFLTMWRFLPPQLEDLGYAEALRRDGLGGDRSVAPRSGTGSAARRRGRRRLAVRVRRRPWRRVRESEYKRRQWRHRAHHAGRRPSWLRPALRKDHVGAEGNAAIQLGRWADGLRLHARDPFV